MTVRREPACVPSLPCNCKVLRSTCIQVNAMGNSNFFKEALTSRRNVLAVMTVVPAWIVLPGPVKASLLGTEPSTDIVEGTENWARIGFETYETWLSQDMTKPVLPGTQLAEVEDAAVDSGSLGFFHGALVGVLLSALVFFRLNDKHSHGHHHRQRHHEELDRTGVRLPPTPSGTITNRTTSTSYVSTDAEHVVVQSTDPEDVQLNVFTAVKLQGMLHDAQVLSQFECPLLHQALDEIRRNPEAVVNYANDTQVMSAVGKLVDINSLLVTRAKH